MEAVWSASARGQQPREKTSRQAFQQHRIALRAAKAEAKALARQQGVEHSFDELLTEEGISLGPPPFSMAQVSSLLGHMPGEQPAEKISPSRLALLQAYDACHERFGGFDEPCMLQRLWPQDTFDEDVRSSATVHIYRAYTGDTTSRFEDLVEEASAIAWRRDAHPTESIPFLYSAWQVQPPTSAAEYARWLREPPLSVGDRDVLIAPSIATGDWTQFSHRRSDQVATQVVEQVPAFYAPEDDFDAKGTSIKRHTANRGLATASYRSSSPAHPASVFQRRRWEKLPTDESRVGPGEYDDWDGKYHKTIARGVHDPWPAAQARRSPARRSATFASATGRSSGVLDGGPAHLNVTMGGGPRRTLRKVTDRLSSVTYGRLREAFDLFDAAGSGFLDYDRLLRALAHCGVQAGSNDMVRRTKIILDMHLEQTSNRLDFEGFAALAADLVGGITKLNGGLPAPATSPRVRRSRTSPREFGAVAPQVARTFHHFDANKSGFLGYRELRNALRHYGLSDATIRDAQSVVRRYDDTPDGRLDLNEFADLVRDLEAGFVRSDAVPPRIARTFYHFDANKSGFLGYRELRDALRHYGLSDATIRDAQSVVRRYDETPDGRLDLNEFAELVRDLEAGVVRSDAVPPKVARTFYHFDANKSGFLGYRELRNALRHYGLSDVTIRDARSVVRRYDDTPDGKLDLREFAELVRDLEAGIIRSSLNYSGNGPRHKWPHRWSVSLTGAVPPRIARTFYHFDANKSGFLGYRELRDALRHYGLSDATIRDAQSVVRRYDDTPDGRLDLNEFAELVSDLEASIIRGRESLTRAVPPKVAHTFYHFDANKSGFLGYRELRDALRHYGLSDATIRDAQSVVRRYDETPDGRLDLNEFAELVRDLEAGVVRSDAVPPGVARTFYHFDANKSGFLGYRELRDALRHYGLSDATIRDAQSVVRRYDETPDGRLDLNEFAELVRDLEAGVVRSDAVPPKVARTFYHFDANKSGFLGYRELRNALRHFGFSDVTLREAQSVVRRYDETPDGRLDLNEFAQLVRDLEAGVVRSDAVPPKVARTFYHFDANKSGFLGYRELRNALRHFGFSDVTLREAQSVVRRYDETPDGRLDLNEFAQLVRDLEAGVVRSDAVSPSPNPISPYSGRYTSPGAPEHRWARHMQRKLDEADDRWRLLSGVRSEMQAVRLEAQELTDHATMALSHIELKRREAEERALAAEKESADSQARIRDAERLAEFASAAWKNTEARLVAKEKQAATERKRLLQEAADLKRDAHRIISGRSSTSPFLRPPQIVTPLSEAPQYHSLSTFAEPSSVTRAFYHFDANKSGFLGYRELRDALRHYGLSDATIRDAQSVLRRYDDTPDGRLDLNEFAELVRDLEAGVIRSPVAPLGGVTAGWTPPDERSSASPLVPMPHGSPAVSSHVRQAFARFQQNGLISKPDLVAALSQYGLSITEEEVRAISIAYGEQSSGLNVYEFAALVSDVEFGLSSSLRAPGATSAKSKLYGASPPQQRPVQSLPRPSQPESQIAATQMRRPTATETKYPMNTQAVESSAVRAPMSSAPDWWQTRRWCLCFCPDVLPDSVVVRDLLRKDPL